MILYQRRTETKQKCDVSKEAACDGFEVWIGVSDESCSSINMKTFICNNNLIFSISVIVLECLTSRKINN